VSEVWRGFDKGSGCRYAALAKASSTTNGQSTVLVICGAERTAVNWINNTVLEVHDWLSRDVLMALMFAQQQLRPSRRQMARAFRDGMRFRRETAHWGDEQKRNWTLRRLRTVVRDAASTSQFYKDLFQRIGFDPRAEFSFEEFAELPALEKANVQLEGDNLRSARVPPSQLRKIATGGSTGTPTEVFAGPEELGWRSSSGVYESERVGLSIGCRTALYWGHYLDPHGNDSLKDRVSYFIHNRRWFDCFRTAPDVLDSVHSELNRYRPDCVVAYSTALGLLAEHVLDCGYKAHYPRVCAVTGAEKLTPRHRRLAEQAFGCPIYEQYGTRDVGLIAYQRDQACSGGYMVDWPNVMVERDSAREASELLVTKLHADGMPMLRYRVGDEASYPTGTPVGPIFVLNDIIGRTTERLFLRDGRSIHGIIFPHLLKDYPIRDFSVYQRADSSVEVRLVAGSSFSAAHSEDIARLMGANLPGLLVRIKMVEGIMRNAANKWSPVVSDFKAACDAWEKVAQ